MEHMEIERAGAAELIAREGAIAVARLRLERGLGAGARIAELAGAPGACSALVEAAVAEGAAEARLWAGAPPAHEALLAAHGFRPWFASAHAERALGDVAPPAGLAARTLAAAGEEVFRSVLGRALASQPNRYLAADAGGLIRLLEARPRAGEDRRLWSVVSAEGADIGVILPRLSRGSLGFMGLVAEARGRGLGEALHRLGLWLLGSHGATTYRDMTDVRNAAMVAIFKRNGCRLAAIGRWYRRGG